MTLVYQAAVGSGFVGPETSNLEIFFKEIKYKITNTKLGIRMNMYVK